MKSALRSALTKWVSALTGNRPLSNPPCRSRCTPGPLAVECLESRTLLSVLAGGPGAPLAPLAGGDHGGGSSGPLGAALLGGPGSRPSGNGAQGPGYPQPPGSDPQLRSAAAQPPAGALVASLKDSPFALVPIALPRAVGTPESAGAAGPATRAPVSGALPSNGVPAGDGSAAPALALAVPASTNTANTSASSPEGPASHAGPAGPEIPAAANPHGAAGGVVARREALHEPLPEAGELATSSRALPGTSAEATAATAESRPNAVLLNRLPTVDVVVDLPAATVNTVARPSKNPVRDRMVASLLTAVVFAAGAAVVLRSEEEAAAPKARGNG
jgi:hypothetical protein